MLKFPAPFKNAIFVCTHKRPDGHPKPCCRDRGGKELRDTLKDMVRDKGLELGALGHRIARHRRLEGGEFLGTEDLIDQHVAGDGPMAAERQGT